MTSYPTARRVDQADVYHGTTVSDPFRWMEDYSDPELPGWLAAEAEVTEAVLSQVPERDQFRARLMALTDGDEVGGVPRCRGGHWFETRPSNPAGAAGVYLVDGPGGEGRLVLPMPESPDHVVVGEVDPSPDGTKLLWSETIGGSDWKTWRVVDVETGHILQDAVVGAKLWACWLPGSDGFLWIGFDVSAGDRARPTTSPQLRRHLLGDDPATDPVIYERPANPSYFYPSVSTDGRYIILTLLMAPGNGVAIAPMDGPYEFRTIFESDDSLWLVGSAGDEIYVTTTEGAPLGHVIAIDASTDAPCKSWTIVPEAAITLPAIAHAVLVGDWIFTAHEYLGESTIAMYAVDGSESYPIDVPQRHCCYALSSLSDPVTVSPSGDAIYFRVTSLASPSTVLRHDLVTRTTEVVAGGGVELEVVASQLWATSADGTAVPMTVVRNAAFAGDANPPIFIEGYGGGGDSMYPFAYSARKVVWLEAGGAIATAHIRGGGELGAAWQAAAARGGKVKAMEDFIACAERLVEAGSTPDRIGITGRSSGGMLAAAATIRRPDLFGGCFAEVGMFDPLRYHLYGLGSLMIPEYGTSDDPDDFAAMHSYSPLHNVRAGVSYPAFLITVHGDDDRVAPGNGYKFAATLQAAQAGDAPILLRTRDGAGHHGGSSEGLAEELADILAFFTLALGPRPR